MVEILFNYELGTSPPSSVFRELELGHGGCIYTIETNRLYTLRLDLLFCSLSKKVMEKC